MIDKSRIILHIEQPRALRLAFVRNLLLHIYFAFSVILFHIYIRFITLIVIFFYFYHPRTSFTFFFSYNIYQVKFVKYNILSAIINSEIFTFCFFINNYRIVVVFTPFFVNL